MSTEVSPLQSNAYAVNVKTGKRRLIGNKDGMHHVQLSGSGNYVIDNYTSFTIPGISRSFPLPKGKDYQPVDRHQSVGSIQYARNHCRYPQGSRRQDRLILPPDKAGEF